MEKEMWKVKSVVMKYSTWGCYVQTRGDAPEDPKNNLKDYDFPGEHITKKK